MASAISEDGGRSWAHKHDLDVGDGFCMTNNSKEKLNREFSYPSVKQGADGTIHIALTYYRQAIKYVRVTEDWVRQARCAGPSSPAPAPGSALPRRPACSRKEATAITGQQIVVCGASL